MSSPASPEDPELPEPGPFEAPPEPSALPDARLDPLVLKSPETSHTDVLNVVACQKLESTYIEIPASQEPRPIEPLPKQNLLNSTDFEVDDQEIPIFSGETASRYRIQREIARGGVGVIYSAMDRTLGREVAVKVLRTAHRDRTEVQRRFCAEARISCALQHPGFVPIYDFGALADGRPFIVMGLVQGETLSRILGARANPEEDLPKYLGLFDKLCQAVAYAHSKGVIHRDLKPENIMVSPFGVVNVMDWGIAKVLAGAGSEAGADSGPGSTSEPANSIEMQYPELKDAGTEMGVVMGTLAYMSPEQAGGDTDCSDKRLDVFGLGAILCEILTGFPPYVAVGKTVVHQMARTADLEAAFKRLSSSGAEHALLRIARRCLSANPDERFADAAQVGAALGAYLESLLRRAEQDLVRFFDLSMDLFCIAGFDGVFHRINSNFSRVLGYSDREFLTRPFLDFVHEDDRERTIAVMEGMIRGVSVNQFRNRYRDVHGNYRWFEWTAKSILEEQVILAVARDVTERVELEQRLADGWYLTPPTSFPGKEGGDGA